MPCSGAASRSQMSLQRKPKSSGLSVPLDLRLAGDHYFDRSDHLLPDPETDHHSLAECSRKFQLLIFGPISTGWHIGGSHRDRDHDRDRDHWLPPLQGHRICWLSLSSAYIVKSWFMLPLFRDIQNQRCFIYLRSDPYQLIQSDRRLHPQKILLLTDYSYELCSYANLYENFSFITLIKKASSTTVCPCWWLDSWTTVWLQSASSSTFLWRSWYFQSFLSPEDRKVFVFRHGGLCIVLVSISAY